MITVITGQPGNGKTLYTLGVVEALRKKCEVEGTPRGVFYSGIPECTFPWTELEKGEGWTGCPDGSIILVDECQRVFPPRKQGGQVPAHVQALETHRHRGMDLFLITQHPQLLDISVRKLAGRHFHLTRTFGQEVAKVRQWERCVDPHDRSVQAIALASSFPFPKERYGTYKSAEIHTVRKELPWKKFATLIGAVAGIVLLGWFAGSSLMANAKPPDEMSGNRPGFAKGTIVRSAPERTFEPGQLVPSLGPWPWSAPFYDSVAKMHSAPRVAGCYSHRWSDGRLECRCTTQQGSVAAITRDECMMHVQRGLFDPSRADRDDKAYNVAILDRRDAGAMASESGGSTENGPSAVNKPTGGT